MRQGWAVLNRPSSWRILIKEVKTNIICANDPIPKMLCFRDIRSLFFLVYTNNRPSCELAALWLNLIGNNNRIVTNQEFFPLWVNLLLLYLYQWLLRYKCCKSFLLRICWKKSNKVNWVRTNDFKSWISQSDQLDQWAIAALIYIHSELIYILYYNVFFNQLSRNVKIMKKIFFDEIMIKLIIIFPNDDWYH